MNDTIEKNITDYEKRSWALQTYEAHRWGKNAPCPLRHVVNVYHSCGFLCQYCYVWFDKGAPKRKKGLRKSLLHDIKRAEKFGLKKYVVEVSASSDPFQPIEEKYRDSLFVIVTLLEHSYPVLIVTKNSAMILQKEYSEILMNPKLFIDVTITTLREGDRDSIFTGAAPSSEEKLSAISELIEKGKTVRVKIEPVIPTVNTIVGQSAEDLEALISGLYDVGVETVIAKTMRVNKYIPPYLYKSLIDYYKENGVKEGVNYVLNSEVRRRLLNPIYEACTKYGVMFCPCFDYDVFSDKKIVSCRVQNEKEPNIIDIISDRHG